jgi:hypothetical protein
MTSRRVAMDGFSKVRINEGYVEKGGVNMTSQISKRPPAPAPMRPAASGGNASVTVASRKPK